MPRRPVSPKRLAANRANAAKSTGPRTPQGKAHSSQNARKHIFTASTFAVVRLEDLQEIARLRDDLIAVYRPVNSQELFALERVALAQHAILRGARLESGYFTTCLDASFDSGGEPIRLMDPTIAGDGDIEVTRAQNRNFLLGDGFHRLARESNSFTLLLRYQAQAERHYRRAIEEFERLKALREELPNEPITEPDLEQTETTYPDSSGISLQACQPGGISLQACQASQQPQSSRHGHQERPAGHCRRRLPPDLQIVRPLRPRIGRKPALPQNPPHRVHGQPPGHPARVGRTGCGRVRARHEMG